MPDDLRRRPPTGPSRAGAPGPGRSRNGAGRGVPRQSGPAGHRPVVDALLADALRHADLVRPKPAAAFPPDRVAAVADPGQDALRAATSAPDPSTRFPFRWADPEAPADCEPAAPDLDDLAAMAPGPELADLLTRIDPEQASDHALVELAAAAVRLASWAQAASGRYAAALSDRDSMRPDWSVQHPRRSDEGVVGEELAMRLAWSRRAARRMAADGLAFQRELSATGEALACGAIDQPRARVLADWLAGLPVPVALDVQEAVLPRAHRRTVSQLRGDVERALIRVDPAEAAARRKDARAGRRVDKPRPLPHEMAGLYAVLPADRAMRMHATLDAAARTARAAGDGRSLDQLRADGLTDLVLHTSCAGADPAAGTASDASAGPEPALDADRATGTASDAADTGTGTDTDTDTDTDIGSAGGTPCPARRRPVTQVHVTVAMSTLLGLDEEPADLAGYGPVSAETARALAAGGVWQRLVTDPLSGAVLDLGRTRYRPTAALAAHVRARDRTCVQPSCDAAAASCDLDHTREFHARRGRDPGDEPLGTTAADNLGPLCHRDHLVKTEGGFRLRQRAPGEFVWVTPTGHVYDVQPGADVDPPDLRPTAPDTRSELLRSLPPPPGPDEEPPY